MYKLKDLQGIALTSTFPSVYLKKFYLQSKVLGYPFKGDYTFIIVKNTNYEEEEEKEEEEEIGQSKTIKDDIRTIEFYIKVLLVIA